MELELAILDWIQLHLRCGFLDWLMPFVSGLSNHGEIWILLAAVLLLLRRQRAYGLSAACALTLDFPLLVPPPGDASFPSGHTAAAFAVVFALRFSGSPLWRPVLALAAVTAFSRLYLYVHWPTDVLGGVLLGAAVGWAGAKLTKALLKKPKEP